MIVSDCCGAEAGDAFDVAICPDCKEHCEWVSDGCDNDDDPYRDMPEGA
jgi:hypothetical protein